MRFAAVYFVIIGMASLLAPQAAAGHMGHPLSAFDVFVARSLGVAITTVGLTNWSFSTKLDSAMRGLCAANVFANVSLACIDISAVHQGAVASSAWFGISMHVLLGVGFAYCLFRMYSPKDRRSY